MVSGVITRSHIVEGLIDAAISFLSTRCDNVGKAPSTLTPLTATKSQTVTFRTGNNGPSLATISGTGGVNVQTVTFGDATGSATATSTWTETIPYTPLSTAVALSTVKSDLTAYLANYFDPTEKKALTRGRFIAYVLQILQFITQQVVTLVRWNSAIHYYKNTAATVGTAFDVEDRSMNDSDTYTYISNALDDIIKVSSSPGTTIFLPTATASFTSSSSSSSCSSSSCSSTSCSSSSSSSSSSSCSSSSSSCSCFFIAFYDIGGTS